VARARRGGGREPGRPVGGRGVICPSCGAENRSDGKFCFRCGSELARRCGTCGTALRPEARFCDECGTPVETGPASPVRAATAEAPAPAASERRLVSVLFADLVGFTHLAEARDAEDVRDLLTRYFDTCRTLLARYGGTVEKFIGDAVMAVWGTPVAQEDDAERAVRAALDLVDAVAALGQEVGAPELRARAGVLTGEAAVTIGAEGQGMVAGDLVNTAARFQSAAPPGAVYVGEVTRRATEAAVVYEDAGAQELKGKADPVPVWRAMRVVAKVGGGLRSAGLESPFVGRDRELRMIKDLFHVSAEEGRAHLVSVVGVGGIGKSRLMWEVYKYIDGLATTFRWHRGRCLAYGDGVTYWALAEMVRTRAGIVEGEDAGAAREKLQKAVAQTMPDPEERRWVEPRLAHLLGLEEYAARDREDLFAAWRMFYERLADEMPTVMAFEDIQWADQSMLDFIDYLLDWSGNHALFVLTLARPELLERRPSWGAGRKNFTSLSLEPLPPAAMETLLTGLVPGLPVELEERILERAEGVPLYAMETVRMLLDRGLLAAEGSRYRPMGSIEALDVPESLHALIAARLDGLAPQERRVLQDASVLGKTFTRDALAAVSGVPDDALEPLLGSLIRKEVLNLQADPLSPERGQYAFLQDLVKLVAYETLARRDRKARHLAVARHLEATWGSDDDEVVEVVASHYVEAYRAAPDDPDAGEIKALAGAMLARAGERAASLAASAEALRYFEEAANLADDPVQKAEFLERAGRMAWAGGSAETAVTHFERAMSLFEGEGRTHPEARVSARLGVVQWRAGLLDDAIERMEAAFAVLSGDEPDEDLATLAVELGRLHYFRGELGLAQERVETALDLAETLWLPEILSEALNTYGIIQLWRGRAEAGLALTTHALAIALEHDVVPSALRAYNNVGETLARRDRYEDALEQYTKGAGLAHKAGHRNQELSLSVNACYLLVLMGRWDEAVAIVDGVPDPQLTVLGLQASLHLIEVHVARGELERAEALLETFHRYMTAGDVQDRAGVVHARALILLASGDARAALESAEQAWALRESLGVAGEDVKGALVVAVEAALALGDAARARELLAEVEALPPGALPPLLRAQDGRLRARLAAATGEGDPEGGFKMAAGAFRELGTPYWLAVTLADHAEWLVGRGRADDARPLLAEARETFERLRAVVPLERVSTAERRTGAMAGAEGR